MDSYCEGIEQLKMGSMAACDDNSAQTLYEVISEGLYLVAQNCTDLAELNPLGIYHHFKKEALGAFEEFEVHQQMPLHWISRGRYAGIWCTFFDHQNYSPADSLIGRLTLRKGFRVFDPDCPANMQSFADWWAIAENQKKPNVWENQKNASGIDMAERVSRELSAPDHAQFYYDNNYGAIVGRHWSAGLVIINRDLVESLIQVAK